MVNTYDNWFDRYLYKKFAYNAKNNISVNYCVIRFNQFIRNTNSRICVWCSKDSKENM